MQKCNFYYNRKQKKKDWGHYTTENNGLNNDAYIVTNTKSKLIAVNSAWHAQVTVGQDIIKDKWNRTF